MSIIDTLPPLREVIAAHGLSARKSLGQNFLLDLNLTAKIARAAGDLSGADVLEIGPGPGGLTRGLLAEGARRVLAVEKDERCLPALQEIAAAYPDRLEVVNADALEFEAAPALEPRRTFAVTTKTPAHARGRLSRCARRTERSDCSRRPSVWRWSRIGCSRSASSGSSKGGSGPPRSS